MATADAIVLAIVLMVAAMVLAIGVFANRYKRVPVDQAMVVYGARRGEVGFTVIAGGGGRFIRPIVESYKMMSLEVRTLHFRTQAVKTKDGIALNIDVVAQIKISHEKAKLQRAAAQLLSKPMDEVDHMAEEILRARLQQVCAGLPPEQINKDRDALSGMVRDACAADFSDMGLDLVSFNVRDMDDDVGYFASLGAKALDDQKTRARISAEVRAKMEGDPERARRIAVFLEKVASLDEAEFEAVLRLVEGTSKPRT